MSTSATPKEIADAIGDALASAGALLQAGNLNAAEQLYRAVLQLDANHPEANHALARIAAHCGQMEAAAHLFTTALLADPSREQFWLDYLEALLAAGEIAAAKQTLELSRQHGLQLRSPIVERIEPPPRKAAAQPGPAEVKALNDAFQRRDLKKLEALALEVARKYPEATAGWKSLSLAYYHSGRAELAVAPSQKLVELQPNDALMHGNLGLIYMTLRRFPEAEASLLHSITLNPEAADTYVNLGNVRRDQGRHHEAEACYRRAIELEPNHSVALANLGVVQLELGDFRGAEASLRAALAIAPNSAITLSGLASTLAKLGKLEEATAVCRRSIAVDPKNIFAYDLLLFCLNYTHTGKSAEARELALRYDKHVRNKIEAGYTAWNCDPAPQRLKVGLVSGDFNNHPVGFFTEGLLRHLDPTRVEIIAYSSMPERKNDALTSRLRGLVSTWRPIHLLSYKQAAAQIHADGIHVLIDLSGHTTDNRLPVFAMKPAPVQASWLGYFATTGVAEMDWFVGDPWLCPPEEEGDFTEQVWRLPQTWLCFTPPEVDVAVAELPALKNGYVTFGCFNNLNKMNDAVVSLWADLLKRLPTARLFLKAPQLRDAEVRAETIARYTAHGISSDRLILEGPDTRENYLAAYGKVDIGLDPFPYPGGTTSVESLWMGVPVLTLRGERFLSHLGESIAHNAGLADWIATDAADYLAKAASFAADLPALAALRQGMRTRMLASPLLDAESFARGFEDMLWGIWERKDQPRKPLAAKRPSSKQPPQNEIEQLQQLFRKRRYIELEKKGQGIAQRYPHAVAGWKALSLAQHALNKLEAALASTRTLLELLPDEALSHSRLGTICVGLNRLQEGEAAFLRALALDPRLAEAHVNLGYIRRQQGRISEAADCYRQAVAIDTGNAVAHSNLGVVLLEQHDFRSAEGAFRAALALDAKDEAALLGLASTLTSLGNLHEAEALARRLIELNPRNALAYSTLLFIFNYGRNGNTDEALELARRYGAMLTRSARRRYTEWRCEAAPQRLRVGIVSGDLYSHPVGYFLEGLLRNLDPARIEITAYANRPERRNDATSEKLRAQCAAWKDIHTLDDDAAAALIHADGIHLLLDLAGHTGNNRLPVFARKPAPIQAAWLGYFATTGVEQMDYLIGDPNVCPPGEENHFTETIWRLPETYLCFTPPDTDVAVGPLPARVKGYVTFGCFNNVGKLNDAVVALWSLILDQVPDSRLLLKAKQLGDAATVAEVTARFAAHGIATQRLVIEGPSPRKDYLAAYNRVDIVLDPFPYPGGTTSVEALWMGTPVLTLRGERMLAHAGENIMRNMGLPEWIAQDEQDYLHKAVQFAADQPALAALRSGLRARALASPMFDAPRFARFFEEALRAMWQTTGKGSAE
jgi:predicted O-linked N-acetylglucosamine transferase (SPINDLY family)